VQQVEQYNGQTERGRMVRENSLQECVESLAFAANRDPAKVVTLQVEVVGRPLWYVYEDQAALDRDAVFGGERVHWFALINTGEAAP